MSPEELDEERELLQKAMKELRQQIRENGDASGRASKQLEQFGAKLKEFDKAAKTKEIAENFDKLNKKVRQGGTDVNSLAKEFKNLQDAATEHGIILDKDTKVKTDAMRSQIRNQVLAQNSLNAAETAVKAYIQNYVDNLKAVANSISRADNAFDMSANIQKLNIDLVRKTTVGFSDALGTSAVAIGSLFGPAGAVAGVVIGGLTKIFSGAADIEAELLKAGIDIVTEQTKRLVDSYNSTTKAGAIFANGVMGISNMADIAGLSVKDMAKVVVENKEALVSFGGTLANGAEKVTKAYSNMTDAQRRQLMNMGMTVQDQLSATADYMDVLARAGTLRMKSDQQLATESYSYMQNLKTISAITGEEAKAAQKRAKDAATQSMVQSKLQQMGGDSMAKFDAAIRFLPAPLQKAAQQMQAFGTVIDPELAIAISQMPAAQAMLTRITSGVADSSKGIESFTQDMLTMKQEMGETVRQQGLAAGQSIGAVNAAFGSYGTAEQVIESMIKFGTQVKEGGTATENAQQTTKNAAQTTDQLTNSLSEAQVQFNRLAREMESELLPAINNFAGVTNRIISEQHKQLDKILGALGIGRMTPGQNGVPTVAESVKYMQNESTVEWDPNTGELVDKAPATQNKRASGGVAYGPTLTGEDGPEAHIPLKGGSIPMNIDFSPLVQALREQHLLTQELIDQVKDSKDVQERILNASY